MVARENLFLALFATLIPHFHSETGRKNWREASIGGVRVERLPVPKRPRFVPYDDELPARPLVGTDSWLPEIVAGLVFAGIAYLVGSDSSAAAAAAALERGGGAYGTVTLFAATLVAVVESHRHGAARSLLALYVPLPPPFFFWPACRALTPPPQSRHLHPPPPGAGRPALLPRRCPLHR